MDCVSSSASHTPRQEENDAGPTDKPAVKVQKLERQLAELQESTRVALLASWKEVENLRADLEKSQAELAEHRMKSANIELQLNDAREQSKREAKERQRMEHKYQKAVSLGSSDDDKDLSSCVSKPSTGSLLTEFGGNIKRKSHQSLSTIKKSLRDESCPNPGYPVLKRPPSNQIITETRTNSKHLTAFGSLSSLIHGRSSDFEEDMMKQLTTINQVKKEEEMEVELKLQQREAAIKTLECTTRLQSDTILKLRNELNRLLDQGGSSENANAAVLRGTETVFFNSERPEPIGNTPQLKFGCSDVCNSNNPAAVTEELACRLRMVQVALQNNPNP